jgi:hypothetical protein
VKALRIICSIRKKKEISYFVQEIGSHDKNRVFLSNHSFMIELIDNTRKRIFENSEA